VTQYDDLSHVLARVSIHTRARRVTRSDSLLPPHRVGFNPHPRAAGDQTP